MTNNGPPQTAFAHFPPESSSTPMKSLTQQKVRRQLPTPLFSVMFVGMLTPVSLVCCRAHAAVVVSGQVVNGGNAAPVAGAMISFTETVPAPNQGAPQTGPALRELAVSHTLGNGSFILKLPGAGRYFLKVEAPNFLRTERTVDVPADGVVGLQLELTSLSTLYIKLLAPGGAPVTAGKIEVSLLVASQQTGLPAIGTWTTKSAVPGGTVEVFMSPGMHLANASAVGVAVRVDDVGAGCMFRKEWPKEPITLQLTTGDTIIGKVEDGAGKPAAGVQVNLDGADREPTHRFFQGSAVALSASDGSFRFSNLLPGRYILDHLVSAAGTVSRLVTLVSDRAEVTLTEQDGGGVLFSSLRIGIPTGETTLPLAGPMTETPAPGIPISGKIMSNGGPVGGINLGLYDMRNMPAAYTLVDVAMSGADGGYSFQASSPGHYGIMTGSMAPAVDYNAAKQEVDIPATGIIEKDLQLEKRSKVKFRVIGVDGRPVKSGLLRVAIQVQSPLGGWSSGPTGEISEDGFATVKLYNNIQAANITGIDLTVRQETAGWAHLHLNHWPDGPVSVQLRPGGEIKGAVVDNAGSPVKDATLQLYWMTADNGGLHSGGIGDARVKATAPFTLTQLPPGFYRFSAEAPGVPEQTRIVHVLAGTNPFVTIRMDRGQSLTVQVLDSAGRYALNATIRVMRLVVQQGSYPQFEEMRNTEQTARVPVLTGFFPGTYFAVAQLQSGETTSQVVTIVAGKDVSIVLRPSPIKRLSIRVVDVKGNLVAGARVEAFWISNEGWSHLQGDISGTSDKDGKCEVALENLGAYLIRISPPAGESHSHLVDVDASTNAITLAPDAGR